MVTMARVTENRWHLLVPLILTDPSFLSTTTMRSLAAFIFALAATSAAATHSPLSHRHTRRQRAYPTSPPTLVASAWYTGWHAADFSLEDVSWSKYTHMAYTFACVVCPCPPERSFDLFSRITTPESSFISLESSDQQLLPQFVAAAHKYVTYSPFQHEVHLTEQC
jgi:chitinase